MLDAITPANIPAGTRYVAGYVDGLYANMAEMAQRFPNAIRVGYAVSARTDAEALDIEKGDATIAEAVIWSERQIARKVYRPILYTAASNCAELIASCAAAGIPRTSYRLISAHYGPGQHICNVTGPVCGYTAFKPDGTQWTDYQDRYDINLLVDDFFAAHIGQPLAVPSAPTVQEDADMAALVAFPNDPKRREFAMTADKAWHIPNPNILRDLQNAGVIGKNVVEVGQQTLEAISPGCTK